MKPIIQGVIAAFLLFAIYLVAVGLISDWLFLKDQLVRYWYYVVALAGGFGVQFGLYTRLKQIIHGHMSRGMVITSGSTSAVAMISCCAHYLVNLVPILGTTGILTIASRYQVGFFWVGLGFNLFGILFVARRLKMAKA